MSKSKGHANFLQYSDDLFSQLAAAPNKEARLARLQKSYGVQAERPALQRIWAHISEPHGEIGVLPLPAYLQFQAGMATDVPPPHEVTLMAPWRFNGCERLSPEDGVSPHLLEFEAPILILDTGVLGTSRLSLTPDELQKEVSLRQLQIPRTEMSRARQAYRNLPTLTEAERDELALKETASYLKKLAQ